MSAIDKLDHFTVLGTDLDRTRSRYSESGLAEGPPPAFSFPGLRLYSTTNGPPGVPDAATARRPG